MKISNSVSLAVADDCAHQHQLYVYLEGGRFVVRSEFCRILLNLRLRGGGLSRSLRRHLLLRECRTRTKKKTNQASEKMPIPPGNDREARGSRECENPRSLSRMIHKTPAIARVAEGPRELRVRDSPGENAAEECTPIAVRAGTYNVARRICQVAGHSARSDEKMWERLGIGNAEALLALSSHNQPGRVSYHLFHVRHACAFLGSEL